MKKLLAILISLTVAMPVLAADKKPAAKKVIVKKHKKFDSTGRVVDDKPTKPIAKKK